ncbi:NAD(P)/FAD-dependent oxidoreductase [Streptomyces sp. SID14478]|uniref:NAD(P)/FAD-dependent oxidoreductase n=1 Tax=Streptomyces sp. SID14478 TaxID=2706073 RepID=UPI0013DC2258|nr:NAD(P)/FAD-dependent oxidoreductase [Streptomyces sp. SID14478]NEB77623.1 NAD(P)/FAD-dependent oxidoreductase [Streptomyces sp. SID14478]
MNRRRYDADLIVVGAGPAGLATALHAARAGLAVTLFEQRSGPVDKACGEGIMPAGVRRLHALGVRPPGMPLAGIDYLDLAGRRAQARFTYGTGMGVRRTDLHLALRTEAQEAGMHSEQTRITEVSQDCESVSVHGLRARWLVAADGLHSPIRRQLALPTRAGSPRRFGLRRHWRVAPWSNRVEVTWGPHAEAYVTPVSHDLVGVAFLYCPDALPHGAQSLGTYAALLAGFPELNRRLARAAPASAVRGAGPLRQTTSCRTSGRVLLVGDAAGYEDALTGEGISLALAQAEAAVDALVMDRPAHYEESWRRLTRRYRLMTRTLVTATTVPLARSLLVPVCSALPAAFRAGVAQLSH